MKNGNQKQQRRIRNTFFVIFLKFRGKQVMLKKKSCYEKGTFGKKYYRTRGIIFACSIYLGWVPEVRGTNQTNEEMEIYKIKIGSRKSMLSFFEGGTRHSK